MPASTFRAWFIGTIFAAAGYVDDSNPARHPWRTFIDQPVRRAFTNQFFLFSRLGISVTANVVQLLAFPAGKLLEAILPTRTFKTFGYTWSLNPGRFSFKEHTVITIMATTGFALPLYTSLVRLPKILQSIQRVTRAL